VTDPVSGMPEFKHTTVQVRLDLGELVPVGTDRA
jgi:hypothetical protein